MTQFVGRHVSPEMLALGLLELLLTFALAYVMLTPSGGATVDAVSLALTCSLTVGFTAFVIGLYRPQVFEHTRRVVVNTAVSALLAFPAVWVVSKAVGLGPYWPVGYDFLRPLKIASIWCGALVCIRLLFLMAARCNLFVHRVALLATEETASTAAALRAAREGFLTITPLRPDQSEPAYLQHRRIRTLVIGRGTEAAIAPPLLLDYRRCGIKIEFESDFWERHLRRIDIDNLDRDWLSSISRADTVEISHSFGRAFDVMASMALLGLVLPLMALIALLIRLDSKGPILYRQERVGLAGRRFTLLKFRSMRVNAEAGGPAWAQQRDPRVTKVGSFIRRTRIDELPQLMNILRGEMSFIGPRPERPHFVEQLAAVIPFYEERARVKPGLTGWAQVNYPYGASVEDARAKLSFDLYYVKNRSFFLDILILLSTVRVILFQEGAR